MHGSVAYRRTCAVSAFLVGFAAGAAGADPAFFTYGNSYRNIDVPPIGSGSFGVGGDALPDGRLLTVTGNAVYLESAPLSGQFDAVAAFDTGFTGGAVDPAFVSVSPDGSRIAVGTGFGKPVAVFGADVLGTPGSPVTLTSNVASYYDLPHFSGVWRDNSELAITAGDFGSPSRVFVLDADSSPSNPAVTTVIDNIQGASAGVAFDNAGRLYTANGFGLGTPGASDTGWVKAFEPSDWANGPADFESDGVFLAQVLSGSGLVFDDLGHLFIGGGNPAASDTGYLGLLHREAISGVLDGTGSIDLTDPSQFRMLDPRGDMLGFYSAAYNSATGEVYLIDGGDWYATIPAPASGAALLAIGLLAARRRRDAR